MAHRLYRLPPRSLSLQERNVCGLLADGCTTNEIAATLRISAATVRQRIMMAKHRIGVDHRYQVIRWVRQQRAAA